MSFPRYPAYKDSGVEWLGEVPEHWSIEKFRYVCRESGEKIEDEVIGQMLSVSGYRGIEIKAYDDDNKRRTDEELQGYRIVRPGQLVVNTMWLNYAGLGVSAYLGHVSPAYRSYWVNAGVDLRFLHHLMRSSTYVQGYSQLLTGIRPNSLQMSRDDLMAFPILLAPTDEQSRIARFLDHETAKIDALIQEQQRLIELLKEKRQAVISHAVTKGLDPTVPMKDSGVEWLGEVPAHWEVRKLSTITDKITNGYVGPTRDLFVDAGIRYLQSLHIKNNEIRFTPEYFVPPDWSNAHSKSVLKEGDVLVVQTGDIGQSAVVTEEYAGCNCHALIVVSPVRQVLHGDYLAWVLNSGYGKNTLLSIQTGALHPHLNCGYVKDVWIPLPPQSEQKEVVRYLKDELATFSNLTQQSTKIAAFLRARRSALISAAVTGKIDVRNWKPPADEHAFDEEVRQAGLEAVS